MKGRLLLLAELVLLMGFVVSMIGIMILYNHNIPLQLLLEEEREHAKEVERDNGDLKLETSKLQAHNIEREGRFAEMQVTISTLRDDLGAVRSALEEKQNQSMLLRRRYDQVEAEASKVKSLLHVLRAREAEIEDLKRKLHFSAAANKGSGDGDDSLAESGNLTGSTVNTSDDQEVVSNNKTAEIGEVTENGRQDKLDSEEKTKTELGVGRNENLHAGIKLLRRNLENFAQRRKRKKVTTNTRLTGTIGSRKKSTRRRARDGYVHQK